MDRRTSTCREQHRGPLGRKLVDPACLVPRQTGMTGMICEGSTMTRTSFCDNAFLLTATLHAPVGRSFVHSSCSLSTRVGSSPPSGARRTTHRPDRRVGHCQGGRCLGIGSITLLLLASQWHILFNVIAGAMAIPADLKEAAVVFRLTHRESDEAGAREAMRLMVDADFRHSSDFHPLRNLLICRLAVCRPARNSAVPCWLDHAVPWPSIDCGLYAWPDRSARDLRTTWPKSHLLPQLR